MTKTKIVLLAACGVIGVGLFCLGIGKVMGGRAGFYVDGSGIHTITKVNGSGEPYVLAKTKLDAFDSVKISAEDADVTIIPSDGYYLEYQTIGADTKPEYKIAGNELTFSEKPSHQFFFTYFDFSTQGTSGGEYYIKLYVPADTVLKTVELLNEDGNITLSDTQADRVTLKNTSGNISIGKIAASQCEINMENGALAIEALHSDNIKIENEYGDITGQTLQGSKSEINMEDGDLKLNTVEAEMFKLDNDYGDAVITTLNADMADVKMGDGDFTTGTDDISTLLVDNEYGNVTLKLSESLEHYAVDLYTEYGTILLPDNSTIDNDSDEASYVSKNGKGKKIKVECEDGRIVLKNKTSK